MFPSEVLSMTKHTFFALLSFILMFASTKSEGREILLEGKTSYYLSTNDRFRNLYGGAGLYRVEANVEVANHWLVWTNLGYLYASGNTNQGSHSHLHLVPVATGVSYFFKQDPLIPYVGLGPLFAYSYINNGSRYITRHQNGWGGGFLAKLGFLAYITQKLYLDCYTDYSFIRMHFHYGKKITVHQKGDLSGFSFGVGLGCKF
ncbi:MAG: hypothetical protein KDK76_00320 [Chlamydiia bacterium]|nr:hypothetical protein [Chlamydiia bacterium]